MAQTPGSEEPACAVAGAVRSCGCLGLADRDTVSGAVSSLSRALLQDLSSHPTACPDQSTSNSHQEEPYAINPFGSHQSVQTTCTDNVHRQRAQTTCTDKVHRDTENPHCSVSALSLDTELGKAHTWNHWHQEDVCDTIHPPPSWRAARCPREAENSGQDWACKRTGLVGRSSCAPTSCAPACWKDVRFEL